MAKAKNAVIAGDFIGLDVRSCPQGLYLSGKSAEGYYYSYIVVNRSTVERYELVSGTQSPSFTSTIGRGLIGAALFGTVGMVAGAATAKDNGIYRVAVYFVRTTRKTSPAASVCCWRWMRSFMRSSQPPASDRRQTQYRKQERKAL